MNRILTAILVIIFVLGLITTGCQSKGDLNGGLGEAPQIGKPAPDFQFSNPDGQSVSLSDFRGKPVLINFWQIRCPDCRSEMPYIQQVYDEWSDKGLVILAINMGESSSKVSEFMKSYNLSFPVLLDKGGNVAQKYNIRGRIPVTFFIDEDGIIKRMKIGAFISAAEIENSLSEIMP